MANMASRDVTWEACLTPGDLQETEASKGSVCLHSVDLALSMLLSGTLISLILKVVCRIVDIVAVLESCFSVCSRGLLSNRIELLLYYPTLLY